MTTIPKEYKRHRRPKGDPFPYWFPRKLQANREATKLRKQGYSVRLIKQSAGGYELYKRRK